MTDFVELDVRPILKAGGEPFSQIMQAVQGLAPGQGLRLLATFKPTPLLNLMQSRGFGHEARELGGGDWQVDFTPAGNGAAAPAATATTAAPAAAADDDAWPAPAREIDNRQLDPPEPMVRTLAALEELVPGQVLAALLCREPVFLFQELQKRGHSWRGAFEDAGKTTYRVLIRVGTPPGAAA